MAFVRVRDNGIGIPPESLPKIFDMFRQLDGNDQGQGGLGIGLGLVKQLIEMHGGSVEARSGGRGQGAEFTVRLPVVDRRLAAREESEAARKEEMGRMLKVLVVDDNADLVDMLGMVVETTGHDVRKALDGTTAIAAALAYRPDVILLDLGLPGMNGLDVARELRRHAETAGARIVALTGWGQEQDRHQTAQAGFDYHLTKPTDPDRLRALLSDYAHQRA
jgi:CheY-like chemotaxis protein